MVMIDFLIYKTKYYRLKNKYDELKEENKDLKQIINGLKAEVKRLENLTFDEYIENNEVKEELKIMKGEV